MVHKLSIKVPLYNFLQTTGRNLNLLMQFTYMYLEDLVMHFQKMVWFIGVRATVQEILAIKISKKMAHVSGSSSRVSRK